MHSKKWNLVPLESHKHIILMTQNSIVFIVRGRKQKWRNLGEKRKSWKSGFFIFLFTECFIESCGYFEIETYFLNMMLLFPIVGKNIFTPIFFFKISLPMRIQVSIGQIVSGSKFSNGLLCQFVSGSKLKKKNLPKILSCRISSKWNQNQKSLNFWRFRMTYNLGKHSICNVWVFTIKVYRYQYSIKQSVIFF